MTQHLPIIYVRGFAGGTAGIDKAVDDPFYGFNAGATHVRINGTGTPRFYQFESPLLRLMMDHGYALRVEGDQQRLLQSADADSLAARTLWIYRFYDESASTFGAEPRPYRIEEAAEGLVDYIRLVIAKTEGAEQVHLVAHSMGGLVVRSAIQRYLYRAGDGLSPGQAERGVGRAPDPANPAPAEMSGKEAPSFPVSKVVTYGTPHGGIDVELGGAVANWVVDAFGPNGSDIFKRRRMIEYLLPDEAQEAARKDEHWDARTPHYSALAAERYLSLVGTNPGDYDVAGGLSARAVGVSSDGLVQIRNAYVKGANRAYLHRSHSGRYGLVNSEEGYQNLQRFLFGDLKVALSLADLDLDTSDGTSWQADVSLSVRGLPVLMHLQSARTHCPVVLSEDESTASALRPVPLVTTFLLPHESMAPRRYALDVKVSALREEGGFFSFGDHLECVADWQDTLLVDVVHGLDQGVSQARYQWNSTLPRSLRSAEELSQQLAPTRAPDDTPEVPSWIGRIDLPDVARGVLGPDAHLAMAVSGWQ